MVDPDALTVVYNGDVTDLHDFVDEFLQLPDVADNSFDSLDVLKDSGFSGLTSQELKCPCCLQELDDIDFN